MKWNLVILLGVVSASLLLGCASAPKTTPADAGRSREEQPSALAGEKSKELDRQIIGLLLADAEVVVHAHKDTSSPVGMNARMLERYGLVPEFGGCSLAVRDTLIGPKVGEEKITFWFARGRQNVPNVPFLLPEGDYLLFLKREAQERWVLVADYLGLQLLTKGLDELVKEVHGRQGP